MSEVVIKVENLTKEYRLGIINHGTLRQDLQSWWAGMRGREDPNSLVSPAHPPRSLSGNPRLLALNDLSFDVRQGEILGVIGRNGAGKSTLLKILSRVTTPTRGTIKIKGRVASLLEVGTGFHPELTGRENIFLNGAILGMTKIEINDKFDEIVDFAEIEKFIDTPVKRYSSGMYVRLAFAVAAHLEPEILIVDEVLAVGDILFRKKCLGKIGDVARGGRTVLFVSHNMAAVQRLCGRSILLSNGKMIMDGPTEQVINKYMFRKDERGNLQSRRDYETGSAPGDEYVRLRSVTALSDDNTGKSSFRMDERYSIEIVYEVLKPISGFHLYIRVYTQDGILAFCSADWDGGEVENVHRDPGMYRGRLGIPSHLLNRGSYMLSILGIIPSVRIIFNESAALAWRITSEGGVGGAESIERKGIFRPELRWHNEPVK